MQHESVNSVSFRVSNNMISAIRFTLSWDASWTRKFTKIRKQMFYNSEENLLMKTINESCCTSNLKLIVRSISFLLIASQMKTRVGFFVIESYWIKLRSHCYMYGGIFSPELSSKAMPHLPLSVPRLFMYSKNVINRTSTTSQEIPWLRDVPRQQKAARYRKIYFIQSFENLKTAWHFRFQLCKQKAGTARVESHLFRLTRTLGDNSLVI